MPKRSEVDDYPPSAWLLATLFTLDPLLEGKIVAQSETSCWLWTGATQASGSYNNGVYGRLKRRRKLWLVHRWVYTLLVGKIPPRHDVHHRIKVGCKSTLCCNPRHLTAEHKTTHWWIHQELMNYSNP